jgi:hypothetical protein
MNGFDPCFTLYALSIDILAQIFGIGEKLYLMGAFQFWGKFEGG